MAELFDVGVPAISKHLSNIYEEGELSKESTFSKMEIVQDEGGRRVKRTPEFYNLDAIISVGYRVNSRRATQFRIWATSILKEQICVISGLTAHVFRHNYCTQLCYNRTLSTKKIAQLLGDTEKMVIDVYSHLLEEKENAPAAVAAAIAL